MYVLRPCISSSIQLEGAIQADKTELCMEGDK